VGSRGKDQEIQRALEVASQQHQWAMEVQILCHCLPCDPLPSVAFCRAVDFLAASVSLGLCCVQLDTDAGRGSTAGTHPDPAGQVLGGHWGCQAGSQRCQIV